MNGHILLSPSCHEIRTHIICMHSAKHAPVRITLDGYVYLIHPLMAQSLAADNLSQHSYEPTGPVKPAQGYSTRP